MATTWYRPRAHVILTVPFLGTRAQRTQQEASTESLDMVVRPKRVTVIGNDHNEADRCTVVTDWTQAGTDPRMLTDAVAQVHIANANEFGAWTPSRDNCRFIGLLKEVEAFRTMDKSAEVTLDFVDYTDCFLRAKPFGSSGIPSLDQTLEDAWKRVVSQTPGAEVLSDRLRAVGGVDLGVKIGKGAAERFQKLARVATTPETDAWAVWQQCVGMLGLISYIDLDECVVTTATDYYTQKDSPRLIWGDNIEEWSESRMPDVVGVGIGITSYDPLTRKTIEALYPPAGDDRVHRKRAKTKTIGSTDASRQDEKRDYFAVPGISDKEVLDTIAQRVWEERSRQELEGRVTTKHMIVERESGADFDLLTLNSGDSLEVRVRKGERQLLASLPSDAARVSYLESLGYTEDAATLLVRNMAEFDQLGAKFLVRSTSAELELTDEGGSFSAEIRYCNRIVVDGSTDTK